MKEYRLDESTGVVSEKKEWMKRYNTRIFPSWSNRKRLEKLWNQLTPIPTDEMTDMEIDELKKKMEFIFKPVPPEIAWSVLSVHSYSATGCNSSQTVSC